MNTNGLPRDHLSWSAYHLFKTNKDAFRLRYYENQKSFDTTETLYGKATDKRMEDNDKELWYVPRYSASEYAIEAVIHGVKIVGRIDSFDEAKLRFIERKTGHADKNGKAPWDKVKVAKHGQLVFYSMLIKEKFGKVHPVCHLVWQETSFITRTIKMGDMELPELGRAKELQLTGKVKKFSRRIAAWEIQKMKTDLIVVIEQIKNDYENYKRTKGIHVATGNAVASEVAPIKGAL